MKTHKAKAGYLAMAEGVKEIAPNTFDALDKRAAEKMTRKTKYSDEKLLDKGGKITYVSPKTITDLSAVVKGVLKKYTSKEIRKGPYVYEKPTATKVKKAAGTSTDVLYKKIKTLWLSIGDKKQLKRVKESDLEIFRKHLPTKMILALYCGIEAAYKFKGDFEFWNEGLLIPDYTEQDVKDAIKVYRKNITNKTFEIALKYPKYKWKDFRFYNTIPEIKVVRRQASGGFVDYKTWKWEGTNPDGSEVAVVAGKMLMALKRTAAQERIYIKSVTLNDSYLNFVSSRADVINGILEDMAIEKNGYVKDIDLLNNGLGGVPISALKQNKITYAEGGLTTSKIFVMWDDKTKENLQRKDFKTRDEADDFHKQIKKDPNTIAASVDVETYYDDELLSRNTLSYAEGGEIGKYRWYEIDYFDENDMPSGQSLTFKNDEDANRHAENFMIRNDLVDYKVKRTDEIADEDYTNSYPIISWKKMHGGYVESMGDDFDKGVESIAIAFKKWYKGPLTELEDVGPAIDDIAEYVKSRLIAEISIEDIIKRGNAYDIYDMGMDKWMKDWTFYGQVISDNEDLMDYLTEANNDLIKKVIYELNIKLPMIETRDTTNGDTLFEHGDVNLFDGKDNVLDLIRNLEDTEELILTGYDSIYKEYGKFYYSEQGDPSGSSQDPEISVDQLKNKLTDIVSLRLFDWDGIDVNSGIDDDLFIFISNVQFENRVIVYTKAELFDEILEGRILPHSLQTQAKPKFNKGGSIGDNEILPMGQRKIIAEAMDLYKSNLSKKKNLSDNEQDLLWDISQLKSIALFKEIVMKLEFKNKNSRNNYLDEFGKDFPMYATGGGITIPPHADHKEQDEFWERMNTDENAKDGEIKTKNDIKNIFGKSVTDIDISEEGNFIIQGDLDEIKSKADKGNIPLEEVESWGYRIYKYAKGGAIGDVVYFKSGRKKDKIAAGEIYRIFDDEYAVMSNWNQQLVKKSDLVEGPKRESAKFLGIFKDGGTLDVIEYEKMCD